MSTAPRSAAVRLFASAAVLLALSYFAAVLLASGGSLAALRATILAAVPTAVLSVGTVRAGRRLRWFTGSRQRLGLLHGALATTYAAGWSAAVVLLFAAERVLLVDGARFEVHPASFAWCAFTGLLLYAGVAGATFGLDASGRAARAEALRARAELAALRAQLNPHFLFNTLHTVLGLVRRDPALAEEALQDLGDVLRYALEVQRGPEQVPLRDELQFVQRYLAIERVRLGERLRVEEAVSPAALACRLPAFTVQPVVENAVRYAVASRAQGGRVRIEADRDGDDGPLRVVVSDDGAAAPPAAAGAGLGLALVRQRLEAACGAAARVDAGPTDAGFVVRVEVPQAGEAA
jgi:signal transduction histidine kinase